MSIAMVSALFILAISITAYRANIRFHGETRLPMQWGLTGRVNWSAPRHLALAFVPMLAIALLGSVTLLSVNVPPRAGQEHLVLPVSVVVGAMLFAVQVFHLWLIERTIR